MPAASRETTVPSMAARYIPWNIARLAGLAQFGVEAAQVGGDGRGGFAFHGAEKRDQALAEPRDLSPAATRAADRRADDRLAVGHFQAPPQLPCPPVRHAHRPSRRGDGAGLADAFDELRLAGSHSRAALAENAQR